MEWRPSDAARKGDSVGAAERERLIDRAWPGQRSDVARSLGRKGYQRDDLNDAFAALWTAVRVNDGTARTLGSELRDEHGLAMKMWV